MKREIVHKFNLGDAVVMWSNHGADIYDGNLEYVRDFYEIGTKTRYGLSDINEGEPRGYMPADKLLSVSEFQALVDSRQLPYLWKGEAWKLANILNRWQKPNHKKYETITEKGSIISATLIRENHIEIVVIDGFNVQAEWHWNINHAANRFQWLLEHA